MFESRAAHLILADAFSAEGGSASGGSATFFIRYTLLKRGRMAELAYAAALGAAGVTLGGSNPLPPKNRLKSQGLRNDHLRYAGVAQLVEHNLAKVDVAGSNPVSRSNYRFKGSKPTRAALLRARAAGCGGESTNVGSGEQEPTSFAPNYSGTQSVRLIKS